MVTQVVLLRAGSRSIAVPSHLVELVQRQPLEQVQQARMTASTCTAACVCRSTGSALLGGSGTAEMAGAPWPLVV